MLRETRCEMAIIIIIRVLFNRYRGFQRKHPSQFLDRVAAACGMIDFSRSWIKPLFSEASLSPPSLLLHVYEYIFSHVYTRASYFPRSLRRSIKTLCKRSNGYDKLFIQVHSDLRIIHTTPLNLSTQSANVQSRALNFLPQLFVPRKEMLRHRNQLRVHHK